MDGPMRRRGTISWITRTGRLPAVLLSAAVIGGLVLSGLLVAANRRREGSELRSLAAAVGPHRVTRARLTGGFAYVPCDTALPNDSLVVGLVCRTAPPRQWPQYRQLSKLAGAMRATGASGARDESRRHAAGSWNLIWGNLDESVDALRAAARVDPRNASIQSDLAAALLARAERRQDPRSILDAYSAADSAAALRPRLPEARFNRALVLERLNLRADAIAEWSAFLQLDSRSPWAAEAREYLRVLRLPPPEWRSVQASLQAAVAAGDDSVVGRIARTFPSRLSEEVRLATLAWARSYQSGTPRADTLLSRAFTLASGLTVATTDPLWLDVVRSLIDCSQRRDRARLRAAARGFIAYDTGQAYLDRVKGDSAQAPLLRAHRQFVAAHNAARYLTGYGLARVSYMRSSSAEALTALRGVAETTPNAYRRVRGRAIRTEGVVQGVEANFHASIAAFQAAIREGEGTGDPGLDLHPRTNLALDYASLGSDASAWYHLYSALRSAARYADVDADVRLVFIVAARVSARMAPKVASLFQREAVRLAGLATSSRGDSLRLVSALERQAELFGRAGRSEEALEGVRAARAYLSRLGPDSVTASFAVDLDLVDGLAWLALRPDSSVRILRRVVERYRATQYLVEVDRALLLLANAYAAVGLMDSAQRSFGEAIAETERRRANIPTAEDRARFLDVARPVIDQIVTFLVDRGDTLGALEFMERMRGRVLLEHVHGGAAESNRSDRIVDDARSTLPARTSIVSYAVLQRELIAWLIDRDGVSMYRVRDVSELERLTQRFSTLIQAKATTPEVREVAARLHHSLLSPFSSRLKDGSRLIVVPDKWLHFVPFAALFDDATKTFAIEQLEIGTAPSLELYAQSLSRYKRLWAPTSPAVLSVGNPTFDSRAFALPPLPGAEAEATMVAKLYPHARMLMGQRATKRAFLSEMATSDVIHFAGHGVVRTDAPLSSYLVLASDGSGEASAMLTARELFDVRLPKTRLAILSGCQTAGGEVSETEGASSLARALFGAGVPAVVASLWAVDDKATAEFFVAYHRRLSHGEDPTAALRLTQREWLMRTPDHWQGVATWAAFSVFGATADAGEVRKPEHRVSGSSLQEPHWRRCAVPVRIIFRGLTLFQFPEEGEDKGKLVALLVNKAGLTQSDAAAKMGHGPKEHGHHPDYQILSDQRVEKPDFKPKPLLLGEHLDLTVDPPTGKQPDPPNIRKARSFLRHVPNLDNIIAHGTRPEIVALGDDPEKRTPDFSQDLVSNIVKVNRGDVFVRDVVIWDEAGYPLSGYSRDLGERPRTPAVAKFMGSNVDGHMASEVVVQIKDTDIVNVELYKKKITKNIQTKELEIGKREPIGKPAPHKGYSEANPYVPENTVEIVITNYEYQRGIPVPWSLDFQWLFEVAGYGEVDLWDREFAAWEPFATRYNEELFKSDRALLLRKGQMPENTVGRPFPYLESYDALTPLNPLTSILERPLCSNGTTTHPIAPAF